MSFLVLMRTDRYRYRRMAEWQSVGAHDRNHPLLLKE